MASETSLTKNMNGTCSHVQGVYSVLGEENMFTRSGKSGGHISSDFCKHVYSTELLVLD